jgi:hypothetical protein
MAMNRPTAAQVAQWVARSATDQGVPVGVTDHAAVNRVVVLLREGRKPQRVRDAKSG